ncbi:hypothetical protein RU639_009210 [Aspergillus parasiticus]
MSRGLKSSGLSAAPTAANQKGSQTPNLQALLRDQSFTTRLGCQRRRRISPGAPEIPVELPIRAAFGR